MRPSTNSMAQDLLTPNGGIPSNNPSLDDNDLRPVTNSKVGYWKQLASSAPVNSVLRQRGILSFCFSHEKHLSINDRLDFGLMQDGHLASTQSPNHPSWKQAYLRLFDTYVRQAQKASRLIHEVVSVRRDVGDEKSVDGSDQLSFALELLGSPGLLSAAEYIDRNSADLEGMQIVSMSIAHVNDPETEKLRAEILSECLRSDSARVRFVAAESLGEMGGNTAQARLLRLCEEDFDRDVRSVAAAYVK